MQQSNTEGAVDHTNSEQNTGNHKRPGAPEAKGADRFGGTRTGAQNVEAPADLTESAQSGPDIERLKSLDDGPNRDVTGQAHEGRSAERDEHGRL